LEQPFAKIVRKARAVIGDPDGNGRVILFQRSAIHRGVPAVRATPTALWIRLNRIRNMSVGLAVT
jgi:hypothetical protein